MKRFFARGGGGAARPDVEVGAVEEAAEGLGEARVEVEEPRGVEEGAMKKVLGAVVVITTRYPRAFEGKSRGQGTASGFVVDAERGLVLTNRHVVTGGPVQAEAVFSNKEEVELDAVFSDPVHDFGFFRMRSKPRYHEVVALELRPDLVKVGLEIRVIGNDAGEKLSILPGVISRTDRNAPKYRGAYSDFNTFYLSAASNTSPGSSGSPVVDVEGRAVGLNAGAATQAASSFYLPLDRVVRALDFIQRGEAVPRRTLQWVLKHQSFTETERLGLPEDLQQEIRRDSPDATGLLVVKSVVPGGPAEKGGVEPGDILTRLDGDLVYSFQALAEIVDENAEVTLSLRRGNDDVELTLATDDLFGDALDPKEFLEMGDGVLHPLTYVQAVLSRREVGLLAVSSAGKMLGRGGLQGGVVIRGVGEDDTPDIDSFARAMARVPHGAKVSLSFLQPGNNHRKEVRAVTVDRIWFPWRRCKLHRDAHMFEWKYSDWSPAPAPLSSTSEEQSAKTVKLLPGDDARIVHVTFEAPFRTSEVNGSRAAPGVVVDAQHGIVLCAKMTVPTTLGDARITFGSQAEIPAKVLLVHPMHPFSFLQYDPDLVSFKDENDADAKIPPVKPYPGQLHAGDNVRFIGINSSQRPVTQLVQVISVEHVQPMHQNSFSSRSSFGSARNQVVVRLNKNVSSGGILADPDDSASVGGFWFNGGGLPSQVVFECLDACRAQEWNVDDAITSLAVSFGTIPMSKATTAMGLSDDWVETFQELSTERHVLKVSSVLVGSHSDGVLQPGDLLLAIDDTPVVDYRDVERATQDADQVDIVILRELKELTLGAVPTTRLPFAGIDRVVMFAGAVFHHPSLDVGFSGFLPEACKGQGVFVAHCSRGSPAKVAHLRSGCFVTKINNHEIVNLDELLDAIHGLDELQFFRLHVVNFTNDTHVLTVKADSTFWRTTELVYDGSRTWNIRAL